MRAHAAREAQPLLLGLSPARVEPELRTEPEPLGEFEPHAAIAVAAASAGECGGAVGPQPGVAAAVSTHLALFSGWRRRCRSVGGACDLGGT